MVGSRGAWPEAVRAGPLQGLAALLGEEPQGPQPAAQEPSRKPEEEPSRKTAGYEARSGWAPTRGANGDGSQLPFRPPPGVGRSSGPPAIAGYPIAESGPGRFLRGFCGPSGLQNPLLPDPVGEPGRELVTHTVRSSWLGPLRAGPAPGAAGYAHRTADRPADALSELPVARAAESTVASSHCGRNRTLPVDLAGVWPLGGPKCPLVCSKSPLGGPKCEGGAVFGKHSGKDLSIDYLRYSKGYFEKCLGDSGNDKRNENGTFEAKCGVDSDTRILDFCGQGFQGKHPGKVHSMD